MSLELKANEYLALVNGIGYTLRFDKEGAIEAVRVIVGTGDTSRKLAPPGEANSGAISAYKAFHTAGMVKLEDAACKSHSFVPAGLSDIVKAVFASHPDKLSGAQHVSRFSATIDEEAAEPVAHINYNAGNGTGIKLEKKGIPLAVLFAHCRKGDYYLSGVVRYDDLLAKSNFDSGKLTAKHVKPDSTTEDLVIMYACRDIETISLAKAGVVGNTIKTNAVYVCNVTYRELLRHAELGKRAPTGAYTRLTSLPVDPSAAPPITMCGNVASLESLSSGSRPWWVYGGIAVGFLVLSGAVYTISSRIVASRQPKFELRVELENPFTVDAAIRRHEYYVKELYPVDVEVEPRQAEQALRSVEQELAALWQRELTREQRAKVAEIRDALLKLKALGVER